jgi:hypothetical protein
MEAEGNEVEKVEGSEKKGLAMSNCRKHFSEVWQDMHIETRRPVLSTELLEGTERMRRIRSLLSLI